MTALGLLFVDRGRDLSEFQGFLRSDSDRWLVVAATFVVSAALFWAWGRLSSRRHAA